ncbi:DUF6712 family protein [Flavobacterium sp. PLA-1-15]|uniref:DUF6712 family protein n=1 Tax=Flavobacterium sp. PLA-1-15 TaxID=3380533 RepID=UPI003B8270A4
MKLLFNETTKFRDILGFLDGDYPFKALKQNLITATEDLVKIIGDPIYDSLVGIFESDSSSEDDKFFLERVQYTIALDAYRNSAKGGDLGHTPNGRNNRIEEHQKIAFEWQIDRSDRDLERKYYRSIDALINFMDKKVSGWKSSDAYKLTHNLFIRTVAEFEESFIIDSSRLLFIKLAPGIKKAETEEILPRIGKEAFLTLKEGLKENATGLDQQLLSFIREALVYESLSWAIPRMSAQLFPEGVLQVSDASRLTTAARTAAIKNTAEALAQRFEEDAAKAYLKIENHLKAEIVPAVDIKPIKPNFNPGDNFVSC